MKVYKQIGSRGTRGRHKIGDKNLTNYLVSVGRPKINNKGNQIRYVQFAIYCD